MTEDVPLCGGLKLAKEAVVGTAVWMVALLRRLIHVICALRRDWVRCGRVDHEDGMVAGNVMTQLLRGGGYRV